ncbi:MAG: OmpA family protein [Bacteroidia bacterium]
MKSFFLFFALLVCSLTGLAQENKTGFTIYFETNSARIDESAQASLDSLAHLLESSASYTLDLSAHTDQQGNPSYNQRLSQLREYAVQNALVQLGVSPSSIKGSHHGEEIPLVQAEETEAIRENRRVEIRVNYLIFNNADEVLSYTGVNSKQQFMFEDNGPQEVQGTKGTQLLIPSDAFQTKSGQAIPNNEVVFVLEEFPGMGEAISHQLSTLSGGQILESGGMFRMEAYYQGEALDLKTGKEIDVRLPSTNVQKGMSVFVGNRNEQGVVVWEETKAEFKAVDTTIKPKLPLPGYADLIRSNRIPITEKPVYTPLEFVMDVPVIPTAPKEPRKPIYPKEPAKPEGKDPGWKGAFQSEWRSYKKAHKNYESALASYNVRLEQYTKNKEKYSLRYARYQSDSINYLSDSSQWQNLLVLMREERVEAMNQHYAFYDLMRFNGALNSIAKKMNDSLYYSASILGDIRKISSYEVEDQTRYNLDKLYNDLLLINYLSATDFPDNKRYLCTRNTVNYSLFFKSIKSKRLEKNVSYRLYPTWATRDQNQYYRALNADLSMRGNLLKMERQIRAKKKELGIFDERDAYNVYQASLSRMGFINCDRFTDYAPEQMANLDVNVPRGTKVFVVVSSLNSLIPLFSGHDSTAAVRLPIGEEIKVVSIGSYNGRPTYDYQKIKLKSQGNLVTLEPKIVSLETLTRQLDGL